MRDACVRVHVCTGLCVYEQRSPTLETTRRDTHTLVHERCTCLCVRACMYVCVFACARVQIYVHMYVCVHACTCARAYGCPQAPVQGSRAQNHGRLAHLHELHLRVLVRERQQATACSAQRTAISTPRTRRAAHMRWLQVRARDARGRCGSAGRARTHAAARSVDGQFRRHVWTPAAYVCECAQEAPSSGRPVPRPSRLLARPFRRDSALEMLNAMRCAVPGHGARTRPAARGVRAGTHCTLAHACACAVTRSRMLVPAPCARAITSPLL